MQIAVVACCLTAPAAAHAADPYLTTYGSEEAAQHARALAEQVTQDAAARERYIRGAGIVTGMSRTEIETLLAERPEHAALLTVALLDQNGRTLVGCPEEGPCLEQPESGTGRFVVGAPTSAAVQPGDDTATTEEDYVIVNTDTYHAGPATDSDSQIEGEDQFMDSAIGATAPPAGASPAFTSAAAMSNPCRIPATNRVRAVDSFGFTQYNLWLQYGRFCWNWYGFTQYANWYKDCSIGRIYQFTAACELRDFGSHHRYKRRVLTATPGGHQVDSAFAKFQLLFGTPAYKIPYQRWTLRMACKGDGSCWRGRRSSQK